MQYSEHGSVKTLTSRMQINLVHYSKPAGKVSCNLKMERNRHMSTYLCFKQSKSILIVVIVIDRLVVDPL